MEVTRSGHPGNILHVAKNAVEDFNNVLVNEINHAESIKRNAKVYLLVRTEKVFILLKVPL